VQRILPKSVSGVSNVQNHLRVGQQQGMVQSNAGMGTSASTTGSSEKSGITTGMNENKSTVGNTASPSTNLTDKSQTLATR